MIWQLKVISKFSHSAESSSLYCSKHLTFSIEHHRDLSKNHSPALQLIREDYEYLGKYLALSA